MMSGRSRLRTHEGFTVIEVMIVVGIVAILVSVATVSYNHVVTKAKAVEGEIVVHEVERLEHLYQATDHVYTDSLDALGFAMAVELKYYTPEVRLGSATTGINYQVRALPIRVSSSDAWLLTSYRDGSVRVDRTLASDLDVFASVRYRGNTTTLTSSEATTIYLAGAASITDEPEWSGTGSTSRCQECGRVVVNKPTIPAPGNK